MDKTVTYISNSKEIFTATVIEDRGNGILDLQIKRPGGRTQNILKVPKKDKSKFVTKYCWFVTQKPKPIVKPTPESSQTTINS